MHLGVWNTGISIHPGGMSPQSSSLSAAAAEEATLLPIPHVTKIQASRLWQNHTTLQHEQRSSGELNILQDFSLQPAVTFSFVTGSVRCFDYCILHFFLNLTIPL
jgi:hypothetical protein